MRLRAPSWLSEAFFHGPSCRWRKKRSRQPPQAVRVKVTVRNVGPVVETLLSSVGNGSGWVSLVPSNCPYSPVMRTLRLSFPAACIAVGAQTYPIGIKVTSEVDPNESTVAELSITVNPFYESAQCQ